jgi:hypothetical protein
MNPDDPHSTSADSMRELMDEKMKIQGGIDPSREQELGALLQSLRGVENVSVTGDDLSITYEPTQITSREIHDRLKGAGFTTGNTALAPADPPIHH